MIEPIKMKPCPFCEGPPCIIAQNTFTREVVDEGHHCDPNAEVWPDFEAHVWCHECGAQGPVADSIQLGLEHMYDMEVADVIRVAIGFWNDRDNRARNCYDAGEQEGLNFWPRATA